MCFYILLDKTWNKSYGFVIKTYISYVCVTGAFVCPNIVNFHNYLFPYVLFIFLFFVLKKTKTSLRHQPSDNPLCGLQLLQQHGDSDLGFGVRGQLVQGHCCGRHRRFPELHVSLGQLPHHHAQVRRKVHGARHRHL